MPADLPRSRSEMRRGDEGIAHREVITVPVRAHGTGPAGGAVWEPPVAAEPAEGPGREGQGGRGSGAGSPGAILSSLAAAVVFLLVLYLLN